MSLEYKKTVDNFRVNIRRKYIDEIFAEERKRVNSQFHQKQFEQLKAMLITPEQRIQYLTDKAKKFQGEPELSWKQNLNQLFYLVKVYQNQHHLWVSSGILRSITAIFKVNELQKFLQIIKIVCNILVDILYMSSNTHPKVIKSIMSYDFIDDFISLFGAHQQIQFLRLLASLLESVPQLRPYIYSKNCLKITLQIIITSQLQAITNNNQIVYSSFVVLYSFVKIHQIDQATSLNPRKCIVDEILLFVQQQYTNQMYEYKIQMLMIKILYEICRLNKIEIYQKIINSERIVTKTISILTQHAQNSIRVSAGKLISQMLMSTNPLHIMKIFDHGIINKVMEAYQSDRSPQVLVVYLSILSNLIADDPAFQNSVLSHPIFSQMVLYEAQNSQNIGVRRQAIYCICNFLFDKTPEFLRKIIIQYKILEIQVGTIQKSDTDQETIRDILKTWKNMIQVCDEEQQQNQDGNCAFIALTQYYRIQEILTQNQDLQLSVDIEIFLDFLNNFR